MATRRRDTGASDLDERKPPAKRQRREGENNATPSNMSTTHLSLLDLNDNCLVHMLSHLHFNDLNNVAMTCRQLCQLRAHESLNQTRTATIMCRQGTTSFSFATTIDDNNWNSELVGNLTHLRIEHIERILHDPFIARAMAQRAALNNIQSLDCSLPRRIDQQISESTFYHLTHLLPNLVSLDLSNITASLGAVVHFWEQRPKLRKLTWNYSRRPCLFFDGWTFKNAPNLTHLYVDDCQFIREDDEQDRALPEEDRLLWRCKSLERVSIKNASFTLNRDDPSPTFQSVSQAMLINFVRNKPTLRWFRSDLTPENVEMLRSERPDVTFVS